jgi:AraC-like DNA-binding protein
MSGKLQHTTIATWVMPILRTLQPYCDSVELLKKTGIDGRCVVDAHQRISLEKMTCLWELAEEVSGDDCIGLEVIKHVTPTSFHALTYAHHASNSLRESLERIEKFSAVISTAIQIKITETENEIAVIWHRADDHLHSSHHPVDAFMGLIVIAGLQIVAHNRHLIIGAKLTRQQPKDTSRHDKLYKCPITYAADHCELRLSRQYVDTQLPTSNAELVRVNEQVLSEYLTRFRKNDVVDAVYKALIELMPQGEPTQEKVAKALGTSSRSLHRKLKALDTRYKTILDDTRKRLAMQYLQQSGLAITSITYQLGFSDASSFSRSFKRWTGLSPTEFRHSSAKLSLRLDSVILN